MEFSIKIDGLENLKKLKSKMKKGLYKGIKNATYFAESKAKKNFGGPNQLHVRTGHLRRSIKSKVVEKSGLPEGHIGSDVVYAKIHEFGGMAGHGRKVRIPARPFLKPAVENNIKEIRKIIHKSITQEMNK